MRLVADGVYQLNGFPPNGINVYLVDDVLIDSGTRLGARRILRQLRGRDVRAHALTHAHPDHFGSTHEVCEALGVPLWCGEDDVEAAETGVVPRRDDSPLRPLLDRLPQVDGHPVARRLREGDEVAGFRVLDVPGHSPGHVAFWREGDRALICGDVFFNLPRLGPPPGGLTFDPERNRESMRKLAALEPALVLFGHGPPLRDARRFAEAARSA